MAFHFPDVTLCQTTSLRLETIQQKPYLNKKFGTLANLTK